MDSSFRLKSFTVAPTPFTGVNHDTRKRIQLHSTGDAIDLYKTAAERLLYVNEWNTLESMEGQQYALFDINGDAKTGKAEEGDYIRINNTQALNLQKEKRYDWVRIEKMVQFEHKERNTTAMRVRPAADPTLKVPFKNRPTAHYYTSSATTTFIVERTETMVMVGIHPRNQVLNTAQATGFYNQLRNVVVGLMGLLGITKNQWKILLEGLVHEKEAA